MSDTEGIDDRVASSISARGHEQTRLVTPWGHTVRELQTPPGVLHFKTDCSLLDEETNPLSRDRSDPGAADDITTINQLHVPVDKPVMIHLTSKDVIHCFALQEMRVKQDIIPGIMTPTWFVPTVTTDEMRVIKDLPKYNYEIACAQLCGLGHYRMRGFMTIHTQEDFDAWLVEEAAEIAAEREG